MESNNSAEDKNQDTSDINVDAESEHRTKKQRVSESPSLPTCAVCMSVESSDKPFVENHGCSRCAPNSWRICEECNECLLSRLCPVCRSDYAPTLMYAVPGRQICDALDKTISKEERLKLLTLTTILRSLLTKMNLVVWCPSENVMMFSLPKNADDNENEEEGNDNDEAQQPPQEEEHADEGKSEAPKQPMCCIVEIPMDSSKIENGVFKFVNSTWDDIIDQSEKGAEGVSLLPGAALSRLFSTTSKQGAQLMTPLEPNVIEALIEQTMSSS